jgi:hypothetical protein
MERRIPGHVAGVRFTGRFLAMGILALGVIQSAIGQDSHYWSSQYGTQAQLLGGLVVGSSNDLSSTYYNPGALALTRDTALVLSTIAQQFTHIQLQFLNEPPIQMESDISGPSPTIFALRLPPDLVAGHGLAFSYLVRNRVQVDLHGRTIASTPQLSVADDALFFQDISETWVGLSWASRITDSIAFGTTWYVAPMSQRQRTQTIQQAATVDGEGSTVVQFLDLYYNNVRTLFKLGLYFDYRPISFGLSLTTPSINLFNTSGWVMVNQSAVVADSGGGLAQLASNHQQDLTSRYQPPLSIALGAAYTIGSTSLYFSAEWFDAVSEYEVLNAEDFVSQTTGEPISISLTQTRSSVLNFGAGFHHRFSTLFSLYGSFLVDNSYLPEGDSSPVNFASYDLTHITGGVSFTIPTAEVTLGISYAFGADSYATSRYVLQVGSRPVLNSSFVPVEVEYDRLGFVLGFTLRL